MDSSHNPPPRPTGKDKWAAMSDEERAARTKVADFMNRTPGRAWTTEEVNLLVESSSRGEELRLPDGPVVPTPPATVHTPAQRPPVVVAPFVQSTTPNTIPVSEALEREERMARYHNATVEQYRQDIATLQETLNSIREGHAKEDRDLDLAIRRAQLDLLLEQVRVAKSGVMEAGMARVADALERLANSKARPDASKKEG